MIRVIVPIILLFIVIFPPNSYGSEKATHLEFENAPGPALLYPVTDNISLAGKDFLEFRWERRGIIKTRHYEFKLYKGYKTLASTLILKETVSLDTFPIKMPAYLFKDNQVYTWSLRQVFFNGEKSGRSFSPFKIIKR